MEKGNANIWETSPEQRGKSCLSLEPPGYRRQLIEMQISKGLSATTWKVDGEVGGGRT